MKTITPKLEAYFNNISTGKQMAIDQKIYLMIKERPLTIEQLRNYGEPHQTITSAVDRLEKLGLIYKDGKVKGKKLNYSLYVASKTMLQCKENIQAVKQRDFERWVKVGTKKGFFELL
jgi:DNA-binding MarR family transcriptional regulator